MTRVFKYAQEQLVLNMPIKERKQYVLTQMIEELRAYINNLVLDGFSPQGEFIIGLKNQLISFRQFRGELLK